MQLRKSDYHRTASAFSLLSALFLLTLASPAGATNYQGCDWVSGMVGHEYTSCGDRGACCDTHDDCYTAHGCTAASWTCSPFTCPTLSVVVGGLSGPWSGLFFGYMCNATLDQTCTPANRSMACHQCNATVAACFAYPYAAGSAPGPADCCTALHQPDTCGDPLAPPSPVPTKPYLLDSPTPGTPLAEIAGCSGEYDEVVTEYGYENEGAHVIPLYIGKVDGVNHYTIAMDLGDPAYNCYDGHVIVIGGDYTGPEAVSICNAFPSEEIMQIIFNHGCFNIPPQYVLTRIVFYRTETSDHLETNTYGYYGTIETVCR